MNQISDETRRKIIDNIRVLILATNMDHHETILKEWKLISRDFTFNSEKCRLALMKYGELISISQRASWYINGIRPSASKMTSVL